MLDYASRRTVQLQKQYDMLLKSIIYSDASEKQSIYYELNKIEKDIINYTGVLHKEEYDKLINTKTALLQEEKNRLVSLIELIEGRRKYLSEIVEKHRRNVDMSFEMPDILGQDRIGEFQKKIRIIDKYKQNIKLKDKLIKEIDVLKDKVNKGEVKVRSNDRINRELETKMVDMLEKSFKAMGIYSYKEREKEIERGFEEINFAREKAIQNIDRARLSNNSILMIECEKMYESILEEYDKYYEKKMLLRLLGMYDRVVNSYDELLAKRDEINDILSQIDNSDFYKLVFNEINKQYNTIKLEQQDLKTFRSIKDEKESKERLLKEVERENSSEEFAIVLDELLKNEKILQDREEQARRRKEYEERQKRLIEESKKQEEIRKKQKMLEEERKRDIEIRTKELLEKQRNGFIPKVNDIEKNKSKEKEQTASDNEIKKEDFFKPEEVVEPEVKEEFFQPKEEVKEEIEVEQKENKYDDILQDTDAFKIPVIKNDKLVAKKVKEEKVSNNDVEEFMKNFLVDSKKDEIMEGNDMAFPDMPL